jgi:hypothetical protein
MRQNKKLWSYFNFSYNLTTSTFAFRILIGKQKKVLIAFWLHQKEFVSFHTVTRDTVVPVHAMKA